MPARGGTDDADPGALARDPLVGDQDGLDVSPPLTRAAAARLLWRLVHETGGWYRDREATRAQADLNGRYLFFHRWPCAGPACAPVWQTDYFPPRDAPAAPARRRRPPRAAGEAASTRRRAGAGRARRRAR
jgi:hypothetical protein